MITRRLFLQAVPPVVCLTAAGAFHYYNMTSNAMESSVSKNNPQGGAVLKPPMFVSIWKFGQAVAEAANATYQSSHSMLDAIERGIWVSESDVENSSVGIGGTPNAAGVLQLDACIMAGPGHRAGAVAGLESIAHPISVARKVMEKTKHVLLVGDGARKFALDHGFVAAELPIPKQRELWKAWQEKQAATIKSQSSTDNPPSNLPHEQVAANDHDTITLLGVDEKGDVYGGCSTSGLAYKLPGRVGDSPIIGSGLYVDNDVGGAGATGVGENIMRYCGSFMIVELMRNGLSPQQACEAAIRRIALKDPRAVSELSINFIAVNKRGEFGAAGTSPNFVYAVCNPGASRLSNARILSSTDIPKP